MRKIYSYKICYRKNNKKLKLYLITNTLDSANWSVKYYKNYPPVDKKTNIVLKDKTWYVIPITNRLKHKWLWRGCPF